MSNGFASPAGRSPSAAASSSIVASARVSLSAVRNGPTSSAMVACRVWIIAAVLRSGPPSAATSAIASRASAGRNAWRPPRARSAALRPARRPNTSASVIALPDSRLAPLAPPTASPATRRPGTSVSMRGSAATPPMW